MPYSKAQPYDTDLRVPFMIRGPGPRLRAELDLELLNFPVCSCIVGGLLYHRYSPRGNHRTIGLNIDVAPTIAALLGTAPPPEARIDGRSLEHCSLQQIIWVRPGREIHPGAQTSF